MTCSRSFSQHVTELGSKARSDHWLTWFKVSLPTSHREEKEEPVSRQWQFHWGPLSKGETLSSMTPRFCGLGSLGPEPGQDGEGVGWVPESHKDGWKVPALFSLAVKHRADSLIPSDPSQAVQ